MLLPEAFLGTTDSAFNSSIISKTIFPLYSFLGSSIKMLIFLKFNYVFLISENIKMADRKPVNNESQRFKVFILGFKHLTQIIIIKNRKNRQKDKNPFNYYSYLEVRFLN